MHTPGVLFGREGECARIDRLLADARQGMSGALALVGEAGSGKTSLLDHAVVAAGDARIVRARGLETETDFVYGGLHELVRPLLDAVEELPPVQAAALRGALALGEPQAAGRLSIGAAVLSLLSAGAAQGTLVCAVDDVHWMDRASVDALLFAARRLEAEGVAMLFTSRDPLAGSAIETVVLGGLADDAVAALLEREAQHAVSPAVAGRLGAETGGNPRALVDIALRLSPPQLAGDEPLPHPLPVGPDLEETYTRPAAALSVDARRALVIAATADTRAMRVISRADAATRSAFEECEEAGLITVDAGEVAFNHPLVRASVYQQASPAERREAHRALAEAFSVDERYAERRAWHAAAAAVGPDENVAAGLEAAAETAQARRSHAGAAAMYERAARLTPEPEPRARRLYLAARSSWLDGRRDRAVALLEDAMPTDPLVRADIVYLRARIGDADDLSEHASQVEGLDPSRAALLLALASERAGEEADRISLAERAVALSKGRGGRGELMATLALARALGDADRSEDAVASLATAKDLFRSGLESDPELILAMVDAVAAVDPDDHAFARTLLNELTGAARAHAVVVLPRALLHLGWLEFESGRWREAGSHFAESARLSEATGTLGDRAGAAAALALLDALQHGTANPAGVSEDVIARVRGLAELGRGDAVAAARHLADGGAPMRGLPPVAVDLAEALVRAGRPNDAAAAVATLDSLTPAGRWAMGLLGELAQFAGTADAFVDRPFLAARVRLNHGEALRREGLRREARAELAEALALFDALDAGPWAERTRQELRASGASPRRREPTTLDELTPQELLVARTVATEATYKDAAAKLFLSPKTVEYHLRKVYRKLGITSGRQLAQRLNEEGLLEE